MLLKYDDVISMLTVVNILAKDINYGVNKNLILTLNQNQIISNKTYFFERGGIENCFNIIFKNFKQLFNQNFKTWLTSYKQKVNFYKQKILKFFNLKFEIYEIISGFYKPGLYFTRFKVKFKLLYNNLEYG